MRVRDLKTAFAEIQGIFESAGARAQGTAFGKIADAVPDSDDELDAYFSKLERIAKTASAPPADRYLNQLMNVGADERRFNEALASIAADKKLKKADLQRIVKGYAGAAHKKANGAQLLDDLKRAFYKRLYEHDSRALAEKATPV